MNTKSYREEPRIEISKETLLIGMKVRMSYGQDNTFKLWSHFSPRIKEIQNKSNQDLYSVQIFDSISYFKVFNPNAEFIKWAAVKVNCPDNIPEGMSQLVLSEGLYAVFTYVGKPSEAYMFYEYIFNSWLPSSHYKLDSRPHFALMGKEYKGEEPDSKEEFWIPIKIK